MPGDVDPNSGNHVIMYNDQGTYNCEINKDSNNDKGIQCWTPPGMNAATLRVKVRADGVLSNSKNWKAHDDFTPTLEKLSPQQCEPGTVVHAEGTLHTGMWNSTMNTNQIENTDICQNRCALRRVYNRGSQCNIYDETDPAGGVYGVYLNDIFSGGDGGFKCKLGGSYVGNQNFTYMVDGEYGRSKTDKSMKRIGPNGHLYDVQTYAVITGLNLHAGGINGGNVITISGRWFWEGHTEVKIAGEICEIISVTDNEIQCRVPKGEETVEGKWYPGSRGMTMRIWDDLRGADGTEQYALYSYEQMSELLKNSPETADEEIDLDVMEWQGVRARYGWKPVGRDYSTVRFKGIMEGFFAPEIDSKYALKGHGDDTVRSYFTGEQELALNSSHGESTKILHELKGGEFYPIALTHYDGGGDSWGRLEVYQEDNVWITTDEHPTIPKSAEHGFHLTVDNEDETQTILFNNLPSNLKTSGGANEEYSYAECEKTSKMALFSKNKCLKNSAKMFP